MSPDQTVEFQGIKVQQVDVGDLTVGRIVTEPGWRWSTHVRPDVGGDWCEARHVGVVLSGRFRDRDAGDGITSWVTEDEFRSRPVTTGTPSATNRVQIPVVGVAGLRGIPHSPAHTTGRWSRCYSLISLTLRRWRNDWADVAWRYVLSAHYEVTAAGVGTPPRPRGQHDRRWAARDVRWAGRRLALRRGGRPGRWSGRLADPCQRARRRSRSSGE